MSQRDGIGHLHAEPESIWNRSGIFRDGVGVRQHDFTRSKKAPEPLVYFDAIVLLGIFGQIVGVRRVGID